MRKNNKKLKLFSLIFLILFCVYFQTIVYSALSSTMTITGDAYARAVKDVRITNFKLNSSSINSTSSYEKFGVNTISTKFNLVDSSSSIVFDVEVTNYGSADVGILQLIGTVPTGLSYEIINYNLKDKICDDTGKCNQMAVKTFQIKFTGTPGEYELTKEIEFRTYHKVIYTDITNNNYPTEVIDGGNLIITFKEDLKKVTILSNGNEINYYDQISNGQTITIENVSSEIEIKQEVILINVVSGDGTKTSDEVCIGEECFYVMYSDDTTVTMLAKYNLYVGNYVSDSKIEGLSSVDNNIKVSKLDYNLSDYKVLHIFSEPEIYDSHPFSSPTGKQDSEMKGWVSAEPPYKGVTKFSDTNYWSSTVSSYPSYVYNENSLLYSYVENYKAYLSTLGYHPSEARLITKEELEGLGCSEEKLSCKTAPSWVYETSYWSGSASSSKYVWYVNSNGYFNNDYAHNNNNNGCRPVITISRSLIDGT